MGGVGQEAVAAIIALVQFREGNIEGIHQRNDFTRHLRASDTGGPVLEIDRLRLGDRFHEATQ